MKLLLEEVKTMILHTFGTPTEVAGVHGESTPFAVATHGAHVANIFGGELGHGSGTSQFELAFLTDGLPLATRLTALVS